MGKKLKTIYRTVEKEIVGKGENAGYQHFLLFPQCFQKSFLLGVVKSRDCLVIGCPLTCRKFKDNRMYKMHSLILIDTFINTLRPTFYIPLIITEVVVVLGPL